MFLRHLSLNLSVSGRQEEKMHAKRGMKTHLHGAETEHVSKEYREKNRSWSETLQFHLENKSRSFSTLEVSANMGLARTRTRKFQRREIEVKGKKKKRE